MIWSSNPSRVKKFTSSSQRPDWLCDYLVSYSVGSGGYFPGGKVAGKWDWPLTSIWCWGEEWVELYLHSNCMLSWHV